MNLTATDVDAHVARIAQDGYTILEDAIDTSMLDALRADLERIENEARVVPAENIFEGFKTIRIYNLLARGTIYEAIPVHDNVLPIVERVLDRGCLVSSLSSIAIGADEVPQPLHADDQLIPLPRPHVPLVCNTMWAVTDFTAENGATRIDPGSHARDRAPELGESPPTLIAAAMKRGSVLVYNGSLWHGGGANTTQARRIGIAMNYCAGWMRQQENQQLGIPLDVARGFSTRLRKLCGFGLYRGLLGHIDKCSPADLLDGVGPRRVVGAFG